MGRSFVEESNLPVHISKLRRSLGEIKGKRFIETIQGSGYRFVAPVQSVNGDAWQSSLRGLDRPIASGKSSKLSFDSIAVLPIENESANSDLDYIAGGLTESITNSLSLIPELRVIARNTAFRYKNKDCRRERSRRKPWRSHRFEISAAATAKGIGLDDFRLRCDGLRSQAARRSEACGIVAARVLLITQLAKKL